MKKIIFISAVLISMVNTKSRAQLTGDSVVCSGFVYTYTASIPGAVTYNWTAPFGWYDLNGQGSSIINVTCNVTDGNICAEGFDANANSLGTLCMAVQFGGGAQGWDLMPNPISGCLDPPFTFTPYIQPNGTGGGACPPGCGNGILHPNLQYCLYYGAWPFSVFISIIDGVTQASSIGIPPGPVYAYFVDITNGFQPPDAIMISGGCGGAVINNVADLSFIDPLWPIFGFIGGNCIGDTVAVTEGSGASFNYWDFAWGCTLISGQFSYPAWVIIDSSYCELYFDGFDINGCHTYGVWQANFSPCTSPVAGFSAVETMLCPGTCTDFLNTSSNATGVQWLFPGGNPYSSTLNNPQNICYANPGSYDVTQIVFNSLGSDTLLQSGYINVYPFPPPLSISQSGDTLNASPVFSTYQWFYNGMLIPGATNVFYIALSSGDYNVVVTDANGCEVEAAIQNVIANKNELFPAPGITFSPNPVSDMMVIDGSGKILNFICICGISGNRISPGIPVSFSDAKMKIYVSSLPAGMYFLHVGDGGKTFWLRFIKE